MNLTILRVRLILKSTPFLLSGRFSLLLFKKIQKRTGPDRPRVLKLGFDLERGDFVPLVHGGRASEKVWVSVRCRASLQCY